MKTHLNKILVTCAAALAMLVSTSNLRADVTVGVNDSTGSWLGFMNVFELDMTTPAFSSGWGVPDLKATFNDALNLLTLEATPIGDPDGFWYLNPPGGPGSTGNKWMEANLYQEFNDDPVYSGQTVTFEFDVLGNSFTQNSTRAFIRDFAPDFSSSNDVFFDITGAGSFSIDLATDAGAGRHVQYGFQTVGVNVWPGDEAGLGSVTLQTIPEPTSLALLGLGALGMIARRRRS